MAVYSQISVRRCRPDIAHHLNDTASVRFALLAWRIGESALLSVHVCSGCGGFWSSDGF